MNNIACTISTSLINSLKFRFPTKHIPVLSFFLLMRSSPASVAIFFTSFFKKSPNGNIVRFRALCAICDKKNVWSLCVSFALSNLASVNNDFLIKFLVNLKWLYLYLLKIFPKMVQMMNERNVQYILHQH